MRASRNLVQNTAVVLGALLLSWGLLAAAMSFEGTSTAFGRWFSNHPAGEELPTHGDIDFVLSGMGTMLWRYQYLYVPAIAVSVALLVGLLARNWHWVWLPAMLAQSLVAAMTVAVHGSRLDLGVLNSFLIVTASAVLATFLVRHRERVKLKRTNA